MMYVSIPSRSVYIDESEPMHLPGNLTLIARITVIGMLSFLLIFFVVSLTPPTSNLGQNVVSAQPVPNAVE